MTARSQLLVGAIVPLGVVALLLALSDDAAELRPLSILLGVVVALAILAGSRAAVTAGIVSVVIGWWRFVPVVRSFRFEDTGAALGLLLYVLTVAAVVVLVTQLERARRRTEEERATWEELFFRSPIGLALFDQDARLVRGNQHLAALDGRPADESLVRQVAETGEALGPLALRSRVPGRGDAHWSVSYFPVEVGRHRLVGATVADVTADVVRRERSELLLSVARTFNEAVSVDAAERLVAPLVAAALGARVVIVHRDPAGLRATCSAGYEGDPWAGVVLGREEVDGDPTAAELALRDRLGDRTIRWQPVRLPGSTTVAGGFSVAWDHERIVTDDSRILLETIAALAGASIARIDLSEVMAADRFRHAMDAMIDQVTMAHAIRGADGSIEDFEIDFVNRSSLDGAGRDDAELAGRRVCELYPGWRASGMFDRFARVVETGEPIIEDRVAYTDRLADGTPISGHWTLQVVRVDDGYIAASRDMTAIVEAEEAVRASERARERERIAVDLLQEVALPAVLPRTDWLEVGAHYRPARKDTPIGGDWYDAFRLDDDRVCVLIADVSGHGPQAAAFMVQVRNITRSVIAEVVDPGRALGRVNRILHQLGQAGGPFVTVCLAVIDRSAASLTWALAGHPPPVLTRAGVSEALEAPIGPPLAVFDRVDWTTATTALEPGDRITLCTDGLIERRDEVIDLGLARLVAATASLLATDAGAAADELAGQVADPSDDLAVLCAWYG